MWLFIFEDHRFDEGWQRGLFGFGRDRPIFWLGRKLLRAYGVGPVFEAKLGISLASRLFLWFSSSGTLGVTGVSNTSERFDLWKGFPKLFSQIRPYCRCGILYLNPSFQVPC